MNFDKLYSHVTGELVESISELNVFESGKKCAELSKKAYKIKHNLNERLNSDDDAELCELIDIYEEIAKEIARTVYENK